jgi:FixJ family two-component response regulator
MIIIVDDESRFREALQGLLKSANFASTVFSSAEEALNSGLLAKASCVITDMRMPGMHGLELQSQIKRDYPGLPIIMISGHRSEQTRLRALSEGASAFLYKPLEPDDLFQALSLALLNSDRDH